MKALLLLAALMCTGCATSDNWTRQDTQREIAFQLINAADAWQTSQLRGRSDVEEAGRVARVVLGAEPKGGETVMYFATMGVSHYVISRMLPAKWRPWWQRGTVAYAGSVVYGNCNEFDLC